MTEIKTTKIPRRQKCVDKDHPYIGGSVDVIDDALGKPQSQVNQEIISEETNLDGKIATEKQRAEGVEGGLNTRLQTVEELATISVGGGDIGIGTAADFESDDPSDLAKVPTVGAMLGGANDGVYDISARHSGATYADLAAALGTNGANVPVGVRKGGMSVKFVRTSDNKYVKFFCTADEFTTDVTQWQGVDEEPTAGSDNLVKSGGIWEQVSKKSEDFLRTIERTGSGNENFGVLAVATNIKKFVNTGSSNVILKIFADTTSNIKTTKTLTPSEVFIYEYKEESVGINITWDSACSIDIYEVSITPILNYASEIEEKVDDVAIKGYVKSLFRTITKTGGGNENFGVNVNPSDSFYFENTSNSPVEIAVYGETTGTVLATYNIKGHSFAIFTNTHTYKTAGINFTWRDDVTLNIYICKNVADTVIDNSLLRTIERTGNGGENFGVSISSGNIKCFTNRSESVVLLTIYGSSTSQIVLDSYPLQPQVPFYFINYYTNLPMVGIRLVWTNDCVIDIYNSKYINDAVEDLQSEKYSFKNKKIFTYGDSLVYGGGWQNYIATLGCTIINSGIGGSTLAYRDREQYVNADGKYVGDPQQGYTPQQGDILINDTGSGTQRMEFIPNDANYLIVYFGTNDFSQNKPIGTFEDADNTTFKGAIKALVTWVRTNRPTCKILFCTPTITSNNASANSLGLYKIDYINAILEAANKLNICVINLWAELSIGIENLSYFTSDGTHWNNLGKKVVGEFLTGFLLAEKPITL